MKSLLLFLFSGSDWKHAVFYNRFSKSFYKLEGYMLSLGFHLGYCIYTFLSTCSHSTSSSCTQNNKFLNMYFRCRKEYLVQVILGSLWITETKEKAFCAVQQKATIDRFYNISHVSLKLLHKNIYSIILCFHRSKFHCVQRGLYPDMCAALSTLHATL